jgi:SAM-dependent methyltransferase
MNIDGRWMPPWSILRWMANPSDVVMDAGCGVEHPVAIPDPRMKLLQTDLANFEYAEPFDAIFCISVLEHLDQHQLHRSLTNFHRLLRPGGCLILTFDYPSVNLDLVGMTLKSTGFKTFHCDYSRDDNTLNGLNSKCPNPDRLYLNVFRTFAVKPSDAQLPRRPS